MRYPDNFDEARRIGVITVGSPATLREQIAAQRETSGCTYFVSRFAYGDLTFAESARSLDLFAAEVMPHFAEDATRPASGSREVHLSPQPKPGITGPHFNNGKEVIQCLIVANRGRA